MWRTGLCAGSQLIYLKQSQTHKMKWTVPNGFTSCWTARRFHFPMAYKLKNLLWGGHGLIGFCFSVFIYTKNGVSHRIVYNKKVWRFSLLIIIQSLKQFKAIQDLQTSHTRPIDLCLCNSSLNLLPAFFRTRYFANFCCHPKSSWIGKTLFIQSKLQQNGEDCRDLMAAWQYP